MSKIKGYVAIQMNLEQRKAEMKKNLHNLHSGTYGSLELGIEGRFTNLIIWISNEKCMVEGGGDKKIFMRLDCANQYSVPFEKENIRLNNEHKAITKLSKFGFISSIECLDEILEITKDMPIRPSIEW